jgi:hypothetical protein
MFLHRRNSTASDSGFIMKTWQKLAQPNTVYGIIKQTGISAQYASVASSDGTFANNAHGVFHTTATNTHRMAYHATDYRQSTNSFPDNSQQQLVYLFDAANSRMYRNGITDSTGNPGTNPFDGKIRIGADHNLQYAMSGYFYQWMIFKTRLTTPVINALGKYFESRGYTAWSNL